MKLEDLRGQKELFTSFIKFQAEFEGLKADGNNPHFKSSYITLDGILQTVRPLLAKNGLALMQNAFSQEEKICVQTFLVHESGQALETDILSMQMLDNPQKNGSLITYMKRYSVGALLGVCESSDDDGNMATFGNGFKPPIKTLEDDIRANVHLISEKQLCRLWKLSEGKVEEAKAIMLKYGYTSSKDILKKDYNEICELIENI